RINYPYFSRTVISDTQQAAAICLILQQLNVTYVGAVVYGNQYGRALYQRFREMSEAAGICVADAFEVTDKTTADDLKPLLKEYRDLAVSVVAAFVMDTVAVTLTEAVQHEDTFVFLGSEAWGRNAKVLEGEGGERVRGSLILEPIVFDVDYKFKEFVQSWGPEDTESDIWLRKYWESFFNCNLPRGFHNIHPSACSSQPPYFSAADIKGLDESPLVIHTLVATIAAGMAVKDLVAELSQSGTEPKLPLDPAQLSQKIQQVTLDGSGDGSTFNPFGNGGLKVYNVQQDKTSGAYSYVQVGTFFSEALTLDRSKLMFYDQTGRLVETLDSSCRYKTECDKICRTQQAPVDQSTVAPPTDVTPDDGSDDGTDIVVIILGVIVGFLFLIIVVIIVLAVLTLTGRLNWTKSGGKNQGWHMDNYWAGSFDSNPRRAHEQSAGTHSSSSDPRPPLPLRKRKDTLPSDTNETYLDYGMRGTPSYFGSSRATPSPQMCVSPEVASILSPSLFTSGSGYSDHSSQTRHQNNGAVAASQGVENQFNQSLSPSDIALQIQQQQQQQRYQVPPQHFRKTVQQQKQQSPTNVPLDDLRHRQQLTILHALQQPGLDEGTRQQYISLLYRTQQPTDSVHQAHLPNQNQHNQQPSKQGQIQYEGEPGIVLGRPDGTVFFSNVSDASAIYTLPPRPHSTTSPSRDPDYIYVLTAEGTLSPVAYENYARLYQTGLVGNLKTLPGNPTTLSTNTAREAGFHGDTPAPITWYGRDGPRNVQAVAHKSGSTPDFAAPHSSEGSVYAQILKTQADQNPRYPSTIFEGIDVDQESQVDSTLQSDICLEDRPTTTSRPPPPAPHSRFSTGEYLNPLPDPGPEAVSDDPGTDMPALVMLPQTAFGELEDQHDVPLKQDPGNGVSYTTNANNAPQYFPGSHNKAEAAPPQGAAVTYTVASSDYPVKVNQLRMSPMPQKVHGYTQLDDQAPGSHNRRQVQENEGGRSMSDDQPKQHVHTAATPGCPDHVTRTKPRIG
ncbi:hypothetical protein EGW08_016273, partial [Elysia chlorotica]